MEIPVPMISEATPDKTTVPTTFVLISMINSFRDELFFL